MEWFPFFSKIKNKKCLVVGGGSLARHKLEVLLGYGADITVITKSSDGLGDLKDHIKLKQREVKATDIVGMSLVVDATGDESVAQLLSQVCEKADIPINIVNNTKLSTFIFPAVYQKGDLEVAVSTGGASPLAAAWVRDSLAMQVPKDFDRILEKMGRLRKDLMQHEEAQSIRREQLSEAFNKEVKALTGEVYLVGAGCEYADLITMRGLAVLSGADVVVYDDLIDLGLLEYARHDALLIYVGKRSGRHYMAQDEINELLISQALDGKKVCRLKGGDPFVFGRGGEEAMALRAAGIGTHIVPGISSGIAIPAMAGIPVTHRGVSRSFHVITGHIGGGEDGMLDNIAELADLEGTLVFLMGLANLKRISSSLIEAGMDEETPAAVIGSKTVRGSLIDIAERAVDVKTPAVIVIGGSAGIKLWDDGCISIGLTGSVHFRSRVRKSLDNVLPGGADICDLTKTRLELACEPERLLKKLDEGFDVVAFTSPNGVDTFFKLLNMAGCDIRRLGGLRFGVVGPATRDELKKHGIYADIMPTEHSTRAFGEALAYTLKGSDSAKVLLVGADNASHEPDEILDNSGICFERLDIYHMITEKLIKRSIDYIVFGSANGVREYFAGGGILPFKAAVCIGENTATQARESLLNARWHCAVLTAEDTTAEAIAALIYKDAYSRE